MDPYGLTFEQASWVRDRTAERKGLHALGLPSQYQADERERIYIRNDSGVTIPAFGVVVATGADKEDGIWFIKADQPATQIRPVLINGQYDIEPGKKGWAYYGPIVEVLSGDTSPTVGAGWGVDGFEIKKYPTGEPIAWVTVIGEANPDFSTVYAKIEPMHQVLIKAPSGGIPGRAGNNLQGATCDIVVTATSSDTISTSNVSIKVYNWTKTTVCANGDRYGVAVKANGKWQIVAEDCNDTGSVVEPKGMTTAFASVTDPVNTKIPSVTSFGTFGTVSFTQGAGAEPEP